MVEEVFLSPQLKRSLIFSKNLVYTSFPTSCRTTLDLGNSEISEISLHVYNARKYGSLPLNKFLNEISKTKNLEKRAAANNRNKSERFRK